MPVSNVPSAICTGSAQVQLPYGSAEYIGLGFSVLVFLVFIELFGSTFMKNCNVILALLFGYMVAGLTNYNGLPYVDTSKIEDAPAVDFLFTHWFGIGFYGPAVVPLLIAYIVTTVETIGDVTATHEVSELKTDDKEYSQRIQGSLMADAVSSILASMFTTMPNTTFSQNNGVIAMTKCASRRVSVILILIVMLEMLTTEYYLSQNQNIHHSFYTGGFCHRLLAHFDGCVCQGCRNYHIHSRLCHWCVKHTQ